ncbi:conjugative transposon protein TraK [Parachryseolinea silvisoli]|uniref:conjugative transposon protein TraK n=1 Tax=Parachryseolinea silvisoli TaxID=2873601 RepID=UPI00226586A6|nr:conjugative transposon protein TraK [Parachryseolinea silvisoli]MCD9015232.1 conjugative transposon protein TraK [Parachryseolinea silvisoli]
MFRQLTNIDTAFKLSRIITIVVIQALACLCGYVVYQSYRFAAEARETIYILSNGKVLEAWGAERKDNIPVEAKDHIHTFHYSFFTLDPDEKMIQQGVTKALYLADASAKQQYDNLKENRYYSNIISGNISQELQTDSIRIDVNQYPYRFVYHGTLKIIRATSIVMRTLVTEGYLRNVSRTEHNSHGFLIERWNTTENRDIKTINR